MARNRKRAKERRARRPQAVASRSREAPARAGLPEPLQRDGEAPEAVDGAPETVDEPLEPVDMASEPVEDEEPEYGPPSPLEHAVPDVEIAEARLELGSEEQADEARAPLDPELESADGGELFEDEVGGAPRARGGELTQPAGAAAERRAVPGNRVIHFLQGSWRELQRVQWPDRRQVMQATGVVVGFVIVAGVFLGVSDWVAGKVVSFILNGHF